MLAKMFAKFLLSVMFIASAGTFDLEQFSFPQMTLPQLSGPPKPNQEPAAEEKIMSGGHEVKPHSIPYIVFIAMNTGRRPRQCAGVILDKLNVITVASCMTSKKPWDYLVFAGVHNQSEIFSLPSSLQISTGRKLVRHPDFKRLKRNISSNDIGLIHLTTPLEFNKYVNKIKLPTEVERFAGDWANISGWGIKGYDDDGKPLEREGLYGKELRLLNDSYCKQKVEKYLGEDIYHKSMLCGGKKRDGICMGDEGGPMTINGVLEGIANYPLKEECYETYSLFTRVAKFTDWLENNKATAADRISAGETIQPFLFGLIGQQFFFWALLNKFSNTNFV